MLHRSPFFTRLRSVADEARSGAVEHDDEAGRRPDATEDGGDGCREHEHRESELEALERDRERSGRRKAA